MTRAMMGAMTGRIVSRTGRFSVEVGRGALAKRLEVDQPGGPSIQHWIEFRDGETTFEAVCFEGRAESALADNIEHVTGVRAAASDQPGRWFAMTTDKRDGRMRILTIADRGCLASVEAPSGLLPAARADAFLRSLAPAP